VINSNVDGKAQSVCFSDFSLQLVAFNLSTIMTPLQLALLGGTPVRTRPFTRWPIFGKAEERRLVGTLRSGKKTAAKSPVARGKSKRG